MAVDSSAVQIVINVVDGNSGEVVAKVSRALNNLGAAGATSGKQLASGMAGMAGAAKQAGGDVEKLANNVGRAGAEARVFMSGMAGSTTSMQYAMANLLGRSKALQGVWEALFAPAMFLGGVAMIASMAEGAYQLYERFLDVNGAIESFNKKAALAASQKFGQDSSLEDLNADLVRSNHLLDQLQRKKRDSGVDDLGGPVTQYIPGFLREAMAGRGLSAAAALEQPYAPFTMGDAGQLNRAQAKSDQDLMRGIQQRHLQRMGTLESRKTIDEGEQQGYARAAAIRHDEDLIAAENRRFLLDREKQLAKVADRGLKKSDIDYVTVAPGAGKAQEEAEQQKAAAQERVQRFKIAKQQAIEFRHLQEQADEAGLRGVALMEKQRKAAIEDLKDKQMATAAAVDVVNKRYHKDEMRYLQQEKDATGLILARAEAAGLTGAARIEAMGSIQVKQIQQSPDIDASQKPERIKAAQLETQAQIVAAQRQFASQIDSIVDQSANHQISGFARIRAEETKQLDGLKREFDLRYGGLNLNDPAQRSLYNQGHQQYERGRQVIVGSAGQQTADLVRRNAEQTEQIEEQARIRMLSAEKQQTAVIEQEYTDRFNKYQEELQKQEISWGDYNRRVVAAGQDRDAQMIEQARAAQQKMAGELSGFLGMLNRNPHQAFEQFGWHVAGRASSMLLAHIAGGAVQHVAPGAMSGRGTMGMLGEIFGLHPAMMAKHGVPGIFGTHTPTISSVASSATRSAMIASAQIHVGTAQISLGGFSSASTGASYLGGYGLPSSAQGFTGIPTASAGGMGFTPAVARVFGGAAGGPGAAAMPGTPVGQAPPRTSILSSIGGAASQTASFGSSALSLFHRSSSTSAMLQPTNPDIPDGTLNADGSYTLGGKAAPGGMLTGGGFASNLSGAATGATGLWGAANGNGGYGSVLGGALSGAKLGMAVAGPVGAAVGAVAGGVIGAIGFGAAEKARVYYLKQVLPRITGDQNAYAQGGMDYLAAYSDMQSLDASAKLATNAMGPAAQRYYQSHIKPAINKAEQQFTREEKAGRWMYTASAAQYDIGADRIHRDGMAMIHEGERIIPSDQNERITRALEGQGTMQADSDASPEVHLHLHTLDTKTGVQWLMDNKHVLRSAINQSYAENSGGSDM